VDTQTGSNDPAFLLRAERSGLGAGRVFTVTSTLARTAWKCESPSRPSSARGVSCLSRWPSRPPDPESHGVAAGRLLALPHYHFDPASSPSISALNAE